MENFDLDMAVESNEFSQFLTSQKNLYIFIECVNKWETLGLNRVLDCLYHVRKLSKKYKNHTVYSVCNELICECLLALEKYREYLDYSTPEKIYSINDIERTNIRLSVQKYIGEEANPIDIYRTHFPIQSKIVKSNAKLFEIKISEIFDSYAKDKGGWFSILENKKIGVLQKGLYRGSFKTNNLWGKTIPSFKIHIIDYVSVAMKELHATIKNLSTKAENVIRNEYGLSPIAEKWRTETLLFRRIRKEFPGIKVVLHGRPVWLGKQHFDIWIPEYNIAIEYQGLYHFEPVNGIKEFEKNVERDKRKLFLATKNGVDLFYETSSNHDELVAKIKSRIIEKRY